MSPYTPIEETHIVFFVLLCEEILLFPFCFAFTMGLLRATNIRMYAKQFRNSL